MPTSLLTAAVAPEPQKTTRSSSVPPTASWMIRRALAQPGGLRPGAGTLRVGVAVARQHLLAHEVLDEVERAAGRRVVGVDDPLRSVGALQDLVVADEAAADAIQQRGWGGGRGPVHDSGSSMAPAVRRAVARPGMSLRRCRPRLWGVLAVMAGPFSLVSTARGFDRPRGRGERWPSAWADRPTLVPASAGDIPCRVFYQDACEASVGLRGEGARRGHLPHDGGDMGARIVIPVVRAVRPHAAGAPRAVASVPVEPPRATGARIES